MNRRVMGRTGMEVSELGFGGAEIGYEGASQAEVDRLLGSALDSGLNVIDTAECYADSEEKIGKAVAGRRSDFFLFSKVGHASGLPFPDWSVDLIRASIDRSLLRLNVDTIDLIHLHSCDAEILKQGDIYEEVQRAREAGKVRFIGYSGDGEDALCAVNLGVYDSLQTSVNIADQQCLTLTLPKAKAQGMGVVAKRPIANVAWSSGSNPPDNSYNLEYWERLRKLNYDFLAEATAVETALRFTLSQDVHTAIVGTKNPMRWAENAAMARLGALPTETVEAIQQRWAETSDSSWEGQR